MTPRPAWIEALVPYLEKISEWLWPFCEACVLDDKHSYSEGAHNSPVGFSLVRAHACRSKRRKPVYINDDGSIVNTYEIKKGSHDSSTFGAAG